MAAERGYLYTHVENVFLYQGVEYDGDEQVEKHGGHIFGAVLVKVHWLCLLICKKQETKKGLSSGLRRQNKPPKVFRTCSVHKSGTIVLFKTLRCFTGAVNFGSPRTCVTLYWTVMNMMANFAVTCNERNKGAQRSDCCPGETASLGYTEKFHTQKAKPGC